ncbi:MAG: hypothetical protein ACTS85_00035 [Arsenophonus sp. NC-PG7-MAG3]
MKTHPVRITARQWIYLAKTVDMPDKTMKPIYRFAKTVVILMNKIAISVRLRPNIELTYLSILTHYAFKDIIFERI